jgi:formate hydrogenlyase subunit 6/NADH:ubiquinone oxidoreductase subunit I
MFKMTPTIVRNLVVRKPTRRYPAEVREPFDKVRGELVNDIERCIFCGTCEVKCPSRCIQVDKKGSVWTYDPMACVYCGVCVDTCPAKSLYQKTRYRRPMAERLVIRMQGQPRKKGRDRDAPPDAPAPGPGAPPAASDLPPAAAE